jgi:hypothetical protein
MKRERDSIIPASPIEQVLASVRSGKRLLAAENKIDHFLKPETLPKGVGKMPAAGRFHAEQPRLFERKPAAKPHRSGVRIVVASEAPESRQPPYVAGAVKSPPRGKRRSASAPRTPSIFDEDRSSRESVIRQGRGRSPARGFFTPKDASTGGATPVVGNPPEFDQSSKPRRPSPFRPPTFQMAERLQLATSSNAKVEKPSGKKVDAAADGSASSIGALMGNNDFTHARGVNEIKPLGIATKIAPFVPDHPQPRFQGPTKRHPVSTPYQSQILSSESAEARPGSCLYDFKFISNAILHPEMAAKRALPSSDSASAPRARTPQGRSSLFSDASPAERAASTPRQGGRARTPLPPSIVRAKETEAATGGATPLRGVRRFERNHSTSSIAFI